MITRTQLKGFSGTTRQNVLDQANRWLACQPGPVPNLQWHLYPPYRDSGKSIPDPWFLLLSGDVQLSGQEAAFEVNSSFKQSGSGP